MHWKAGKQLPPAAISTENGVKTKDLQSLEKVRNCGLFDSICPELRAKSPQGLINPEAELSPSESTFVRARTVYDPLNSEIVGQIQPVF